MADVYSLYAYSSSIWFAIQGGAIAAFPREIVRILYTTSLTDDDAVPAGAKLTDNSINAIRVLGGFLLVIAAASLAIRAHVPPSQLPSPNEPRTPLTTTTGSATGPPSLGAIVGPITLGLHAIMAAYYYTGYMSENLHANPLDRNTWRWQAPMIASAGLAFLGAGALLFGDDNRPGKKEQEKIDERKKI